MPLLVVQTVGNISRLMRDALSKMIRTGNAMSKVFQTLPPALYNNEGAERLDEMLRQMTLIHSALRSIKSSGGPLKAVPLITNAMPVLRKGMKELVDLMGMMPKNAPAYNTLKTQIGILKRELIEFDQLQTALVADYEGDDQFVAKMKHVWFLLKHADDYARTMTPIASNAILKLILRMSTAVQQIEDMFTDFYAGNYRFKSAAPQGWAKTRATLKASPAPDALIIISNDLIGSIGDAIDIVGRWPETDANHRILALLSDCLTTAGRLKANATLAKQGDL